MTVTIAPTSVGFAAALHQQDVVLLPPLIQMDTMRGTIGFDTGCATAVASVQHTFSDLHQLSHGSYSCEFLFPELCLCLIGLL